MARNVDLMYQILPAVKTRRVTLETSADNNLVVTMDYYIDDYLTPEGVGMLMSLPNSFDRDRQMPKEEEFMKALKVGIVISSRDQGYNSNFIDGYFKGAAVYRKAIDSGIDIMSPDQLRGMMYAAALPVPVALTMTGTTTIDQMMNNMKFNHRGDQREGIVIKKEPARNPKPGQFFEDYSEHFRHADPGNSNGTFYRIPYTLTIGNDPEKEDELIPSDIKDLTIYAFTYLDFRNFGMELSWQDTRYLNLLHGKRNRDTIISKGRVDPYTMVLRDSKGSPYNGPYHLMPAMHRAAGARQRQVFMKGFRHTPGQGPEDYLTAINIPNTKVQDFRRMQRNNGDLFTPFMLPSLTGLAQMPKFLKDKRDKNFNAHLNVHQDPDTGVVGFTFIIDQKQVLEKGSRLGHMFKYLPNLTKYEMLRPKINFKLVNVKVLRRRLTDRNLGINSLGYPARDVFDRNEPDFIVAEASQERSLTQNEQNMKDRGISNPDDRNVALAAQVVRPFSDSFLLDENDNAKTTGQIMDMDRFDVWASINENEEELDRYLQSTDNRTPTGLDGTPIFPFYRVFEGTDLSLVNTVDGTYQYGIELEYEDSMFDFYERALERFKAQLRLLEEYYNLARIPVITAKSTRYRRGNGPGRDEILDTSESGITRMGNYNAITKKFEPEFIQMASETFDFTSMETAYYDLLGLIKANKDFILRENEGLGSRFSQQVSDQRASGELDNEALVFEAFGRGMITEILYPQNNRPEQIAQVLKSFQDLETEANKILGAPSEGDQSKASSQIGSKRNFTSGKNRTIKVNRWFSGEGDSEVGSYYVDCTLRRIDTIDMGLAQARYQEEVDRQQAQREAGARLAAEVEARRERERERVRQERDNRENLQMAQAPQGPGADEQFQVATVGAGPQFQAAMAEEVEQAPRAPRPRRRGSRRAEARRRREERAARAARQARTKGGNGFPYMTPADLAERVVQEKQKWGDALDNYLSNAAVLTFEGYKGNTKQKNSWFTWGSGKDSTRKMGTRGSFRIWGGMGEKKQALEAIDLSRKNTQDKPWWDSFNWGDSQKNPVNAGKGGKANQAEVPQTALGEIKTRLAIEMNSLTNMAVSVPSGPAFEQALKSVDEKELCGIGNEPDEPEGFPAPSLKETLRQAGAAHHSFLDISNILIKDMGNEINTNVLQNTLTQGAPNGLGGLGATIAPSNQMLPTPPEVAKKYPAVNSAVLDAAAVLERMDGFARDADGNINLGKPMYSAVNQTDIAAGRALPGKYRIRYAQDPSTEAGNQTKANKRPWIGGGMG